MKNVAFSIANGDNLATFAVEGAILGNFEPDRYRTGTDKKSIDSFTVAEIKAFSGDSVVTARCSECGEEHDVEPDATGYDCDRCGTEESVTSPLVKLGLI